MTEEHRNQTVCECYLEVKKKYEDKLDELGFTVIPKCGHCIEYLCRGYNSTELKKGTAQNYRSSLAIFVNFLHDHNKCVEDIKLGDVQRFFEYRGERERSKSQLMNDKAAIGNVVLKLSAKNILDFELYTKIKEYIKPSAFASGNGYNREGLSNTEIQLLLSEMDDIRNKLMTVSGMEWGPRAEALCVIRVDDLCLGERAVELKNFKTGGTYAMVVTDSLATLLQHWINNERASYVNNKNNPFLFPSRNGGRLSSHSALRIIQSAAEEAEIQEVIGKIPLGGDQKDQSPDGISFRSKYKVDTHVLRHTLRKLLTQANVSEEAKRYALDHSSGEIDNYDDVEECKKEIREKFNGVDIAGL